MDIMQEINDAFHALSIRANEAGAGYGFTGVHNGALDAFRHTIAGAWTANRFGSNITDFLGDANEFVNSSNPFEETMDTYNNQVGIEVDPGFGTI